MTRPGDAELCTLTELGAEVDELAPEWDELARQVGSGFAARPARRTVVAADPAAAQAVWRHLVDVPSRLQAPQPEGRLRISAVGHGRGVVA